MQATLFESGRLQMNEAIELTAASLREYGRRYDHWCFAWSGGKDSTAGVTVVCWLIESGRVPRPKRFTVLYADTRQEILPLWLAAADIRSELEDRGIECQTVIAELDLRMWVYILGRGVPPPNNNTLRYCTRQIKCDPMKAAARSYAEECGGKVLMLTGVRQGESAVRDGRIALSCSRDGAECGQGWFQETMPEDVADTLAPLLTWRVCHVWEWLKHWAPQAEFGDWSTAMLADAYGGDEAEEINARTGCICCPLASRDSALDAVIAMPRWSHLAPLKEIRDVYREMREPRHRLRKPGGERKKDGTLVRNQQRMGPLTLEARRLFLSRVIGIQAEVNRLAARMKRPPVDFLNQEETLRIGELIRSETWPNGWDGTEPHADVDLADCFADGSVQPLLWEEGNFCG